MTESSSDRTEERGVPASAWRFAAGPLITLGVVGLLEALAGTAYPVPVPGMLCLAAVVASVFLAGVWSGLTSATLVVAYALYNIFVLARPSALSQGGWRLAVGVAVAMPGTALLVAWLRRREQRRVRREAARPAERRYRELVEDLDAVIWEAVVDPPHDTFVSKRAEELLGYPVARWLEDPNFWRAIVHPADRERVASECAALMERGDRHVLEYRVVAADGRTVWVRDRVRVVRDGTGRAVRLRGAMVDVTDLKRVEDALRASEARKGAILESALDGIVSMDHRGRILEFNPAAERIFGWPREQAVGRDMAALLIPRALREPHRRGLARFLTSGEGPVLGRRVEMPALRADGSEFRAELTVVAVAAGEAPTFTAFVRDVTERERAERALRESEARNRALIEAVPDLMFVLDREGVFREYRANLGQELYLPPEEFLGKPLAEVMPPELAPRLLAAAARARTTRETQFAEYELPIGGGPRDWEARFVACGDDEVLVLVRDITERRRAEEALRESESKYRQVTEQALDGMSILDLESRFLMVNPETCRIYGYSEAELLRMRLHDITPPEDLPLLPERLKRLREEGSVEAERVLCRKDGARVTVEVRAKLMAGDRILSMVRDITERRQVERALRESEATHRMLMEKATDGISITDADGNILMANPRFCELLGYTREELLQMTLRDIVDPEELARAPLRLDELRARGSMLTVRRLRRKDGSTVTVEVNSGVLPGGGFLGIARDVTERHQAEAETRRTLSLLHATLESTADGILVVDGAGRMVSFNRKFLDMWRIPDDVVAARDDNRALEFVLGQLADPQGFLAKVRELYARPEAESFDVLEFKDGRVFERYSQPQLVDGKSVGRVWSFRDVTERRRAEEALRRSEEQLRQSQKIEAVGRLAGGVAHDFNNLLTAILGYSELLLHGLPAGDPRHRSAEEIQRAAQRAAGLTRQLLAFSRRQVLEPRVLDLNAVVAEMDQMLRRLIGEHIDLVTVRGADLDRVRADPGQIEQVILNLALNARDAMPEGGKLVIETGNVELAEDAAHGQETLPAGRYVMLAVSDTGAGMDEPTRARLFEPFFTTKEMGKGTGLGLATVYGIVKQSGGYIWVYSESGRGTTFKIYLPRVEGEAEAPATSAAHARRGGGETLLLVEDEERVRTLMSGVLARRGYCVLEARHGHEALEAAARSPAPIDLLVTDVVMPGMSGRELAERLQASQPRMRVLYVSGYTDDAIVHHGVLEAGAAFLQKPFDLESLAGKVREVLDATVREARPV